MPQMAIVTLQHKVGPKFRMIVGCTDMMARIEDFTFSAEGCNYSIIEWDQLPLEAAKALGVTRPQTELDQVELFTMRMFNALN